MWIPQKVAPSGRVRDIFPIQLDSLSQKMCRPGHDPPIFKHPGSVVRCSCNRQFYQDRGLPSPYSRSVPVGQNRSIEVRDIIPEMPPFGHGISLCPIKAASSFPSGWTCCLLLVTWLDSQKFMIVYIYACHRFKSVR